MNDYQDELVKLVLETCQHPVGSPQRQKGLTRIIQMVQSKLWHEQTVYYEDALQKTWIYFCRNLCESTTGKQYDPSQASVVTWLNAYLKRRLQDGFIATQEQRKTMVSDYGNAGTGGEGEGGRSLIDSLASAPDIPPLLEQVKHWAETDPDGDLATTHISGHPEVTCQVLLLRRLPPETPWKLLAAELGVSVGSLSSFYTRQCLPRLRTFGTTQGYL